MLIPGKSTAHSLLDSENIYSHGQDTNNTALGGKTPHFGQEIECNIVTSERGCSGGEEDAAHREKWRRAHREGCLSSSVPERNHYQTEWRSV